MIKPFRKFKYNHTILPILTYRIKKFLEINYPAASCGVSKRNYEIPSNKDNWPLYIACILCPSLGNNLLSPVHCLKHHLCYASNHWSKNVRPSAILLLLGAS